MCIYIFFFFFLTVRWTRQITVWRPLHRKRQIETTLSKSHRKNCTNQTGNSCQLGSKWILFSWQTMFLSIRLRGHEGPLQIYIFKALTLPKIQHLDVEISTKYKSITNSKTKSFKRHLEKIGLWWSTWNEWCIQMYFFFFFVQQHCVFSQSDLVIILYVQAEHYTTWKSMFFCSRAEAKFHEPQFCEQMHSWVPSDEQFGSTTSTTEKAGLQHPRMALRLHQVQL